uniref:Uncharacterized protein n=1 Tax=Oryza meridionalis TaxID=40149 RepID=A0A0E0CPA2_9ORYZ
MSQQTSGSEPIKMASNVATAKLRGCDSTGIALKVERAMGRDLDHAPDEAIASDVIIIPEMSPTATSLLCRVSSG